MKVGMKKQFYKRKAAANACPVCGAVGNAPCRSQAAGKVGKVLTGRHVGRKAA